MKKESYHHSKQSMIQLFQFLMFLSETISLLPFRGFLRGGFFR